MHRRVLPIATVFVGFLFIVQVLAQPAPTAHDPVNPHASPEARAVLKYLYSISGKYTLTGQHNYPNHIARWTDRAYDLTGKYPVIFGQDFGFAGGDDKDSIEARPALMTEVERQWRNGSIPAMTWHEVRPTDDEPVTFRGSVQAHLSDFEWSELLTPGTDLNKRWYAQVDVYAGYLKQLRDAHIPVLIRPYHEMNGGWFWWGGRPGENGSAALYRLLFERFVNYHKLDNLIWVWNVNTPGGNAGPFADYFPGTEYVDVLSVDNYSEFKTEYYNDILTLAAGKPIALGEVGAVPPVSVLQSQPKWAWFMVWSDILEFANPLDKLLAVYNFPNSLSRDDARVFGPLAAIRKTTETASFEPVSAEASREVKSLLGQLSSVKTVFSGQENNPNLPSAETDHIFELTTKYPAIYAEDLGILKEAGLETAPARQAIINEAKKQSQAHVIISLTWRATRPTDDEPGSQKDSINGQLSDFEWNELLTPGTHLYQRWIAQVDALALSLKQLQDAHIPVMWHPYPESNGKKYWWAGRKGSYGSAALYRQLFDRLSNHHGLHNLLWVWDATPPGFGSNADGQYIDFFPGLGYVDALQLNVEEPNVRWGGTFLKVFSVNKPIGLRFAGKLPSNDAFALPASWSWFLLAPQPLDPAKSAERDESLRKLYDSFIGTRAP
jgi:mannan endo-1,4-beta-mannosidase